jgi:hypothetical protein
MRFVIQNSDGLYYRDYSHDASYDWYKNIYDARKFKSEEEAEDHRKSLQEQQDSLKIVKIK